MSTLMGNAVSPLRLAEMIRRSWAEGSEPRAAGIWVGGASESSAYATWPVRPGIAPSQPPTVLSVQRSCTESLLPRSVSAGSQGCSPRSGDEPDPSTSHAAVPECSPRSGDEPASPRRAFRFISCSPRSGDEPLRQHTERIGERCSPRSGDEPPCPGVIVTGPRCSPRSGDEPSPTEGRSQADPCSPRSGDEPETRSPIR
jgi:hypothetical protein